MKNIHPINNHLIVEPLARDSFISSHRSSFDEIGVVIAIDSNIGGLKQSGNGSDGQPLYVVEGNVIEVGDRVYFDSWLASKYPTGEEDKTFWLINYDDIRAVQKQTDTTE